MGKESYVAYHIILSEREQLDTNKWPETADPIEEGGSHGECYSYQEVTKISIMG